MWWMALACLETTPTPTQTTTGDSGTVPATPCGGLAGEVCPDDQLCVDAPDDCDPRAGGADCSGACVACEDPSLGRTYVSRDPVTCKAVDLACDTFAFSDGCGCGCATEDVVVL
jgi:hypothetical protein